MIKNKFEITLNNGEKIIAIGRSFDDAVKSLNEEEQEKILKNKNTKVDEDIISDIDTMDKTTKNTHEFAGEIKPENTYEFGGGDTLESLRAKSATAQASGDYEAAELYEKNIKELAAFDKKNQKKKDEEKDKISKLDEESKKAQASGDYEKAQELEDMKKKHKNVAERVSKIDDLKEGKDNGEKMKDVKEENKEEKAAETATKVEAVKKDIESRVRFLEVEKAVERAREAYLNEYKKCLADMKSDQKSDKISTRTFNFMAGAKNIWAEITGGKRVEKKAHKNEEDFYSDKLKALKEEYDQARIQLGNEMYSNKKNELVAAGVTGDELEMRLAEYKANDILGTVIVNERQKTLGAKADMEKKLPKGFLKSIWDGYKNIQPAWKKYLLSTLIFTGAAAGGLGAAGIVGYAGARLAKSIIAGTIVGHGVKGIDYLNKDKDAKFKEEREAKYKNLKNEFAFGNVDLKEYEKYANELRKISDEKEKKRFRTKAAVGMLLGAGVAFASYELMSGADHHEVPKTGDGQPWPPVAKPDHSLDVVIDKGQGEIHFADQLKHAVQEKWGSDMSNAPESVKHIANTSSVELAKEFGGFKPEQINESAMIHQGSTFHMDNEGNLTFKDPVTGESEVVMWGKDISKGADYHGKMFDYKGVKVNSVPHAASINPTQTGVDAGTPSGVRPVQIDPETGKAISTTIGGERAINDSTLNQNNTQINQNQTISNQQTNTEIPQKSAVEEATRTVTSSVQSGEHLHPAHPHMEKAFPATEKVQGIPRNQITEVLTRAINKDRNFPLDAQVMDTPDNAYKMWMYENFGKIEQTSANTYTVKAPNLDLYNMNLMHNAKGVITGNSNYEVAIKTLEEKVKSATGHVLSKDGLSAGQYAQRLISELYKK